MYSSFSADIRKFEVTTMKRMSEILHAAALDAFHEVRAITHVWTGWTRASWQLYVGQTAQGRPRGVYNYHTGAFTSEGTAAKLYRPPTHSKGGGAPVPISAPAPKLKKSITWEDRIYLINNTEYLRFQEESYGLISQAKEIFQRSLTRAARRG